MKHLFQYDNFIEFLKAHSEERRAQNPNWSYGVWARRLGLSGASSITMVLHNQRKPGPKLMSRLNAYFNFNDQEREYFSDLAELHKNSANENLSVYFRERLELARPKEFSF